jgi:SAM-dependent methyltransferase
MNALALLKTGARMVSLSIVSVLRRLVPDIGSKDVYELSSGGPLFRYLKTHARALTFSEYFEDVAPGQFRNGVQCQDVQRLTHASASFDICTSTEVFEHVPDDATAFAEMFRVLRADGILVFTVPLSGDDRTVERAVLRPSGEVRHLLAPNTKGIDCASPRRSLPSGRTGGTSYDVSPMRVFPTPGSCFPKTGFRGALPGRWLSLPGARPNNRPGKNGNST